MTTTSIRLGAPPRPRPRVYVHLVDNRDLDRVMTARRMTNRHLAFLIGKSPAWVAHLRRGAKHRCSVECAAAIEAELHLAAGTLFELRMARERKEPPPKVRATAGATRTSVPRKEGR